VGIAAVLLMVGIHLGGSGGVVGQVDRTLGLRGGAIDTYNQNAATHYMWANIEGFWAHDRSKLSGKYLILTSTGSEFVVSDGKAVYRTGDQMVVDRLTVKPGEPAQLNNFTIELDDEPLDPVLNHLTGRYGDSLIHLSGSIVVDLPEEVVIDSPSGLETIALSGSTVKLSHHPLEQTTQSLHDQYGAGQLQVQVISPRPSGYE
jgi:inner membrane protein